MVCIPLIKESSLYAVQIWIKFTVSPKVEVFVRLRCMLTWFCAKVCLIFLFFYHNVNCSVFSGHGFTNWWSVIKCIIDNNMNKVFLSQIPMNKLLLNIQMKKKNLPKALTGSSYGSDPARSLPMLFYQGNLFEWDWELIMNSMQTCNSVT